MCLAVPAKIKKIEGDGQALVETFGVTRFVALDLLNEKVRPGDYVLIHVGFAIRKIDLDQAEQTLLLHREIMDEHL